MIELSGTGNPGRVGLDRFRTKRDECNAEGSRPPPPSPRLGSARPGPARPQPPVCSVLFRQAGRNISIRLVQVIMFGWAESFLFRHAVTFRRRTPESARVALPCMLRKVSGESRPAEAYRSWAEGRGGHIYDHNKKAISVSRHIQRLP